MIGGDGGVLWMGFVYHGTIMDDGGAGCEWGRYALGDDCGCWWVGCEPYPPPPRPICHYAPTTHCPRPIARLPIVPVPYAPITRCPRPIARLPIVPMSVGNNSIAPPCSIAIPNTPFPPSPPSLPIIFSAPHPPPSRLCDRGAIYKPVSTILLFCHSNIVKIYCSIK